jgi:hypothetical protein
MTSSVIDLCDFVRRYRTENPASEKEEIANASARQFSLSLVRSVYVGRGFAARFSHAGGASFSNTVLSLSALKSYDTGPFVVCVVRPSTVEFLLANSTFIKKISHSSHLLQLGKVRGSFNGSDILRRYGSLENRPENFEALLAIHRGFTWEDNLIRLVQATDEIVATDTRANLSEFDISNILGAPSLAQSLSDHPEYRAISERLRRVVDDKRSQIVDAAQVDNVNLRGNAIEQLVTEAGHFHRLDDLVFPLSVGSQVLVDVKTKILTLKSSPKGYNIDKYLRTLGQGRTVLSFFFIGVDTTARTVLTGFASTLDRSIIEATRMQFHWAGRNSRGVTQLTGDLTSVFRPGFREVVELGRAQVFLQELIDL